MGASFTITGGRELAARLNELGEDVRKKVIRSAVTAAAQVVKKRAKEIAKTKGIEDTGALIRNIAGKVEKQRSPDYVQINIGVRHGQIKDEKKAARKQGRAVKTVDDPWYWWQHEFGNSKKAARPFIRPAFEESKEKALEVMTERVRQRLAKLQ